MRQPTSKAKSFGKSKKGFALVASLAAAAAAVVPVSNALADSNQLGDSNNPTDPKYNVASIYQTFNNTASFLPIADTVSKIQSQMKNAVSPQTPVWNGVGELPSLSAQGFNPSINMDFSGCSIVPMTSYSLYLPTETLPTFWCGAVSNQTQPAQMQSSQTEPLMTPGFGLPDSQALTSPTTHIAI